MKNSYCHQINDGFGCPNLPGRYDEKTPEYCLDCLFGVLEEIFDDVKDLKEKVLKRYYENDD